MQTKPILWRITFGNSTTLTKENLQILPFYTEPIPRTRAFEDALRRKNIPIQSLWRFKFLPKKRNQRFGGVFKTFGQ